MNTKISSMLESLALRLEAATNPEDMLMQAGELLALKYAKTKHIMGGPSVEEQDGVYVLKGSLQPYNDAKINSYLVVLRDGKVEAKVAAQVPSEDAEAQGFTQVSAKKSMTAKGLTSEKLAKALADLAQNAK